MNLHWLWLVHRKKCTSNRTGRYGFDSVSGGCGLFLDGDSTHSEVTPGLPDAGVASHVVQLLRLSTRVAPN